MISAFFGCVKILVSASISKSSNVAITDNRPVNSGIKPYLIKSSVRTSENTSPRLRSSTLLIVEPKPIEELSHLCEMIFSKPAKAPPQINKILLVSTCRNSCCGCLRPPCGGIAATVPSHNFQQSLLHPLTRNIAGDRGVFCLAADFINFVNIDNALLGAPQHYNRRLGAVLR